ncbi:helix-turn-helix transcriptional regulator [Azospirillum sp. B2RO_4]|jgi:transcriptional regulator with XRE-family HTH domain|uniref:helix-turn-helix transcriptional regulator n=1 Tax=Azospirillum sp. B2RO_4 TaxID=3027796 RepID=UPI003DA8A45B
MITAAQLKAARALLDWSQPQLAEASGLSLPTIQRMEKLGPSRSVAANVDAVRKAFEAHGVKFIPEGPYHGDGGPGVRLDKGGPLFG